MVACVDGGEAHILSHQITGREPGDALAAYAANNQRAEHSEDDKW